MSDQEKEIQAAANKVAEQFDTDVILYNGEIETPLDRKFLSLVRSRKRRPNVLLILVTIGGDADAAFRIAKCLQSKYSHVTVFVTGYCKSAGTLIALGANALVFTDDGELGPLDVQMSKKDSLWETQSGLTVNDALHALQTRAYLGFEHFFLQTEERSQGAITVKTASKIATDLAVGLFAPLYSQLDPIHVGEAARAMQVAYHYGLLLRQKSKNFDADMLQHLVSHYPSHTFVIDCEEAQSVFKNVRRPLEAETALAESMEDLGLWPLLGKDHDLRFLSQEPPEASTAVGAALETPLTPQPSAQAEAIIQSLTEESDARANADSRAASNRPPA